jgi:hypothetical protein
MIWFALVLSMVAGAVPYTMNDLGGTLDLPAEWKGKSYTDSGLEAELESRRGKLMFRMWMTGYQVPLDRVAEQAFAEDYAKRLGSFGGRAVSTAVQSHTVIAGRDTLWTEQAFESQKGAKLHAQTAAIAAHGGVIHLRMWSGAQQQSTIAVQLKAMLEAFSLTRGPAKMGDSKVVAPAGFESTLPDGWRAPVGKEQGRVAKITSKLWASSKGTEDCWVAIRPVPLGTPDVMFACGRSWTGGPVDEHSLSSVDSELRELFFRAAASEVPAGTGIPVGDRLGLLFRPREGSGALRMVAAPYDKGLMALWAQAGTLDSEALDAAITGVAERTQFTGPDGGAPIIRADKWISYYLTSRPTSPLVIGPVLGLLGLLGFGVVRLRNRAPKWDDLTEG